MWTASSSCRICNARRYRCRVLTLASVTSRSANGRQYLAFWTVVTIWPWRIRAAMKLRTNARRWAAVRVNFLPFLRWITRASRSGALLRAGQHPERQAQVLHLLAEFLDRGLAEVAQRQQLFLGLGDQVADGADVLGLEAVLRTQGQLQLLDRHAQLVLELVAFLLGRDRHLFV